MSRSMPRASFAFALLLTFLLPLASFAQRTISGRVLAHAAKTPLTQVSVRVDGQSIGTVTDPDGRFTLRLPTDDAAVTFSHLGFETRTVPAAQLGADVVLSEQTYLIGEVQISYVQLQKLLQRTWRLEAASVETAATVLTNRVRAKSAKRVELLEKNLKALHWLLASTRYEFRPNGIVKTKVLIGGIKLRWKLDEETRTLSVINDNGSARHISVRELTANRLVLLSPDANGASVAYVPAK